MRILIYQNPDAGHERHLPDTLVEGLQRAGHEVDWRSLKEHRLSDAAVATFDLVVAAGGDGSVGRTARQLVGAHLPIAVLPMGTANNLASILDAGKHDLVDRINAWSIVPFDAGTVDWGNDAAWFFEGFGVGAFAETAARLTALARTAPPQKSREAELARDLEALRAQAGEQPALEAEIEMDGRTFQARLIMLEVLNIGRLGPGVELAPGVDPTDGALDVILVDETQRDALVAYLQALTRPDPPQPPFTAVRADQVRVRFRQGVCVHVDGGSADVPAGVDIRLGIQPHAVRFLGGLAS